MGVKNGRGVVVDFYNVLGIPFDATEEEIKGSFREMAKLYHPDTSGRDDGSAFALIMEAYKNLSSPERRRAYDNKLIRRGYYRNLKKRNLLEKTRVRYVSAVRDKSVVRFWEHLTWYRFREEDLGFDVVVSLYPWEFNRDNIVWIELPGRGVCPVCRGESRDCRFCHGKGTVHRVFPLFLKIPKGTMCGSIIEVDLSRHRVEPLSYFTMKKVRVMVDCKEERREAV